MSHACVLVKRFVIYVFIDGELKQDIKRLFEIETQNIMSIISNYILFLVNDQVRTLQVIYERHQDFTFIVRLVDLLSKRAHEKLSISIKSNEPQGMIQQTIPEHASTDDSSNTGGENGKQVDTQQHER